MILEENRKKVHKYQTYLIIHNYTPTPHPYPPPHTHPPKSYAVSTHLQSPYSPPYHSQSLPQLKPISSLSFIPHYSYLVLYEVFPFFLVELNRFITFWSGFILSCRLRLRI